MADGTITLKAESDDKGVKVGIKAEGTYYR